ncbi:DUF4136 domain-containing protein [Paraburkholderia sp.]|uniref:DUF4136 domain-containing protein n=1 Tax=Paraburkholderia sp. TaxID=1926495 RepID=UPI003D6DC48D
MMNLGPIRTALLVAGCAAALAGCAGVKTDVHASTSATSLQGDKTYALTRLPSQQTSPAYPQYAALVEAELAKYGFNATDMAHTRYLLSIAYDTRPAAIGIAAGECADSDGAAASESAAVDANADCRTPGESSFSLFGGTTYRHTLTLRFLERTTGREAYKVTSTTRDREADAQHAVPYLVKSALAKFPYADHPDWQVKLRTQDASSAPEVVSVKPVER